MNRDGLNSSSCTLTQLNLKSAVEVMKCSAAVMSFYCAPLSTSPLKSTKSSMQKTHLYQPTVHPNYYLHLCAFTAYLTNAAAEKLPFKAERSTKNEL